MNIDLLLLFVFGFVLLLFMLVNKKKVKLEKIAFPVVYMVLYRTKLGLRLMDKVASKRAKFLKFFSKIGIVFGFIGMALILVVLVWGVYGFLFLGKQPPVAPLFPGVKSAPGLPVLSFWHWIIAIFILAGVHEFNHGLISRVYNVRVKSSGFAVFSFLLPFLPAAFVEPDEEQLKKREKNVQWGVLAAGSFANFITGGIFFLILVLILAPFSYGLIDKEVLLVEDVKDGFPAELNGLKKGEEIKEVNGVWVSEFSLFMESLEKIKPGDKVDVKGKEKSYSLVAVENPENKSKGYLGLSFGSKIKEDVISRYGKNFVSFVFWLRLLIFWIFVANIGVGLFNLLPLGPVDGGRMFYLLALHFLKNEGKAKKLWLGVSFFCLLLIIISMSPFIIKMFEFLFSPFLTLIS